MLLIKSRLLRSNNVLSISVPNAELFVKFELDTVQFVPSKAIAPPLRLAVLFSNIEFSIVPNDEPLANSIAPPKRAAVLFVKLEFLMTPNVAPTSNAIAPPLPVSHGFKPLVTSESSLKVLVATPNASLLSKLHKSNETLSFS